MKHNWEYKKLGEVCEIIGGSTPKTEISEFWNGDLNWFTPAEISDKKYYNSSERKITQAAIKATGLTIMPPGTVLLTSRAPIGKVGITTDYSYCNQGFKNLICHKHIYNEYLYYALIYFNEDIKAKGRGATFKEISKKITENISVPVPPIEVQEQIVAELDQINDLIAKNRELLSHLDTLAQSIFYDTFGDPNSNPKGWEIAHFKDCCMALYAGGDKPKDTTPQPTLNNQIPIYSNGIDRQGLYGFTSTPRTIEPSITISGRGTIGIPFIRKTPFFPIIRLIVATPIPSIINIQYFYYSILAFNLGGKGAAIPQLTVPMVKDLRVPVPPLALQNEFAKKVEAIEAQKAKVEAEITKLQTLINARMDYWFN